MEILDAIWIYDKAKEATIIRYADAKKRRRSLVTDIPPYFFIRRSDKMRLADIAPDRFKRIRNIHDNGEYASFDGIPTVKVEVDMPSSVPLIRDPLEGKGILTYECYDMNTKILTESGFKPFYQLEEYDKVASLIDGKLEFVKPISWYRDWHEGEMVRVDSKHIDLLVTPNHKMYVGKSGQDFHKVKADSIVGSKGISYKRDAEWHREDRETYKMPLWTPKKNGKARIINEVDMDLWLEFLGWYIADGSIDPCLRNRISLSIYNDENEKRLMRVLSSFGLNPTMTRKGEIRVCSKQFCAYLEKFGKAKEKYVPRFIFNLSSRQIMAFLTSLFKGDGHFVNGLFRNYTTSSYRLAEDVLELLLRVGLSGQIWTRKSKGHYINGRWCKAGEGFVVGVSNKRQITTPRSVAIYENYDGPIFCVTVPSGVVYVMRNGKACWCGNSDTPYIKRWMIDGGHKQCPISDILYADIEVDGRERWGTVKSPTQQIISIGMIDNKGNEMFLSDKNERTLLQDFLRIITKKYQLITGWNFNDFDWKYILKRMGKLNMRKPFIPIQRLDSMTAYERFIKPTIKAEKVRVGIDDCGLRHLGEGKIEKYDAFVMWDSFVGDKKRLEAYNMQDVRLNKMLNEDLHLLDPYLQSMKDFPLTLTELERMSYVWESLLMKECQQRNPRLVIPRKRSSAEAEDVDLGGGNILQTVPGYHANVIEMDFKGLYPSMMRLLGISPEYVHRWQQYLIGKFGADGIPWGEKPSALKINLDAVTDYSRFVQAMTREGKEQPMFRMVLGLLQDMRDDAKKMRNKYEEDTDEYTYWNARQLFYKTVLVSSYGVSGLKSGKFFMPNFVNLLTYTTRSTIERTAELFEAKDWIATYGHTDSVIIRRRDNDMDTMEVIKQAYPLAEEMSNEIGNWLVKKVDADRSLVNVIKINPQKIAPDMILSMAKTKKIMDVVWTEGHFAAYRFVGGAEYKRIDAFPLLGEVQMYLTDTVFKKKTTLLGHELQDYLDDMKEKMYSGLLDEKLIISKSLGKEPDDYGKSLPHVRAAETLQKKGKYRHGEKVNYVITSKPKRQVMVATPVLSDEPFPRIDSSAYNHYYAAIKRLIDRWVIFETTEQMTFGGDCSS